MKNSPTLFHAVSDYVMSALLIVAPWLFNFSHDRDATLCTMAFGVSMAIYSLFTDYELSIKRVIPLQVHLALDALMGGLLIAAPFMKHFSHTVWVPHLVLGIVEASMAVLFAFYLGIAGMPHGRGVAR